MTGGGSVIACPDRLVQGPPNENFLVIYLAPVYFFLSEKRRIEVPLT